MTIPNDFLVMSCRWMFLLLDHYLEETNLGAKNKDEVDRRTPIFFSLIFRNDKDFGKNFQMELLSIESA